MPSATLNWTNHAAAADTNRIERSDAGGPFTEISFVAGNIATFQDLSVLEGVTYAYRVRARQAGLNSAYSNIALVTMSGGFGSPNLGSPGLFADYGGYRPQLYTSYGMNTVGGRGQGNSVLIRVNTLSDTGSPLSLNSDGSYSGEFRAALLFPQPRYVVFEISGYIDLRSDINISDPYLTIAGQTAPSPGVTIRMVHSSASEAMILIDSHDLIFQHLRIRPGWGAGISDSICNSGIQMYGGHGYKVVYDHVSISWAQDENIVMSYPNTTGQNNGQTDATFWRSITAEGLSFAPGSGACTGGGTSPGHGIGIYGSSKRSAIIQCIMAKNFERNPYDAGAGTILLLNNLTYDWNGSWGFHFANWVVQPGPWKVNCQGNRWIVGPHSGNTDIDASPGGCTMFWFDNNPNDPDFSAVSGNEAYMIDNTGETNFGITLHQIINQMSYNPSIGSAPAAAPDIAGFVLLPSTDVEAFVSANAGARPLDRDSVDTRILNEIATRTGSLPSKPADVGGYPSLAVNHRAFSDPVNPNAISADPSFNGLDSPGGIAFRTNRDVYLEQLALALEPS